MEKIEKIEKMDITVNRRNFLRLLSVGLISASAYPEMAKALTWKSVASGSSTSNTSIGTVNPSFSETWKKIQSAPIPSSDNAAVASVGSRIYFFAGSAGTNMYVYDTGANTVQKVTYANAFPAKITMLSGAIPISYNGCLYYLGGYDNSSYRQSFYKFDPSSNLWTSMPDMPFANGYHRIAGVFNNKLYLLYNRSGVNLRFVVFDFSAMSWQTSLYPTVTGMSSGTNYSDWFDTVCINDNGVLYGGGSYTSSADYKYFIKFDCSGNTASTLAQLPSKFGNKSGHSNNINGGKMNNNHYVFSGSGSSITGFFSYNASNNSWVDKTSNVSFGTTAPNAACCALSSINGKLYTWGGVGKGATDIWVAS